MRISSRITSVGKNWWPQFPRIDLAACFPKVNGVEQFDESEFRRQVRTCPQIQMSSDDHGAPCAFAAILIASVNDWLDATDTSDETTSKPKIQRQLMRRLERGKSSYVRIDITGVAVPHKSRRVRSTRIRVTTKSNNVVQSCRFERDFAMIIADFCRGYSRRYVERGDPPLVFAPETETLLAELHERTEAEYRREAVRRANDCRLLCASHRNGFCSPCKPYCPHFRAGSCVALDPDDTTTPLPPPPDDLASCGQTERKTKNE